MSYNLSTSPHVRSPLSTRFVMMDVVEALIPATIVGVCVHGFHAFLVVLLAVLTAVASEAVFDQITGKKTTITDGSALVTGLLLALSLPASVPLYIPVLGAVFAIIVVKCLFGGLGCNIFNPALAGRAFLLISFGAAMNRYTIDGVAMATPLAQIAAGEPIDMMAMMVGNASGVIGSSGVALAAGGIFLLIRKGITWEIPVSTIGASLLFTAIFGGHGLDPQFLLPHACGGGLLMAAFFMSTDPVTCPSTTKGQLLYGALTGILCAIFKLFGSAPDSTTYAVLLANLFSLIIDDLFIPTPFGYRVQKDKREDLVPKPVIILTAITLIAGAVLSGVYVMTADRIADNRERANQAALMAVCPDAVSFVHTDAVDAAVAENEGEVYGSGFGNSIINKALAAEDGSGNVVGYVIEVTSKDAYDGSLTLVVGLQTDGTINSISFTELNETAGMGMLCKEDAFRSQFDNVKVSQFRLNKTGTSEEADMIDSVSGASTTSGAVVNAVNAALDFFANRIQ